MSDNEDPRGGVSLTEYMHKIRERNAKEHPLKRLIVCCDGTWQSSNHGLRSTPSNITKLSRSIAKYEQRAENSFVHQVVFYDAGVGTNTDTDESNVGKGVKDRDGLYGLGLDENVCEAYNFLVNNYNIGDEIYLFGFSRGAYTARAVAGLVCSVGICTNDMMDEFWAMYAAYKTKKPEEPISMTTWGCYGRNRFLQGCITDVKIKAIGVFDTVGALGYPTNTIVDVSGSNTPYGFHNTMLHPQIENAFHALAIDEHRAAFGPTLWSIPQPGPGEEKSRTKLIQCWFPGVHINIGGGCNAEGDLELMANITFAWMVDRVRENTDLLFDNSALHEIVRKYAQMVIELTTSPDKSESYAGWGIGRFDDSYTGKMKLAGSIVRTPGQYFAKVETHECIHPVVAYAREGGFRRSVALEGFQRVQNPPEPGNPDQTLKGTYWRKTISPKEQGLLAKTSGLFWSSFAYYKNKSHEVSESKDAIVLLPEFVIPLETDRFKSQERWLASVDLSPYIERSGIASTKERTKQFLEKLDRSE